MNQITMEHLKQLKDSFQYVCYSPNQYKFLASKGNKPIKSSEHIKTGNPYWVFIKNEHLDKCLTEWHRGSKH